MRRAYKSCILAAIVVASTAIVPAAASAATLGSLVQPPGLSACISLEGKSTDGPGTCRKSVIADTTEVVISPDGKFAYSTGYGMGNDVISAFKRSSTGALTGLKGKAKCVSQTGDGLLPGGQCQKARAVGSGDGHSLVLSRDGRFLYVASQDDGSADAEGAVVIFSRNKKSGKLTQLKGRAGCISGNGGSNVGPNTCGKARAMYGGAASVLLSPDQKNLYATSYPGENNHPGIAIFKRSSKNGRLTQLKGKSGCITRDGATITEMSGCAKAPNMSDNFEIGFAGKFVYVPSKTFDLVVVLKRARSGALTAVGGKAGCISDSGFGAGGMGACNKGRGFNHVERVVTSKDGRFLYFNGYSSSQMAMAKRNPKTGALTQKAVVASCLSVDGSSVDGAGTCMDGRAIGRGSKGDISEDGLTLFYTQRDWGIVVLRLNRKTGAFTQLPGMDGCVTYNGASEDGSGTCGKARGIEGLYSATVGPAGTLYSGDDNWKSVARFKINGCRAKSTKPGAAGLKVKVECGAPAKAKLKLTISKAKSRASGVPVVLGSGQGQVATKKTITVRYSAKAGKALKKLSAPEAKSLRGRLLVSGFDALGKGSEVARATSVR